MKKIVLILFLLSFFSVYSHAIEKEKNLYRNIYNTTLFSIGNISIYDSYLSPITYEGLHLGFIDDRMRTSNKYKDFSYQSLFKINLANTQNKANSGNSFYGNITYRWGGHYQYVSNSSLKLYGGTLLGGNIGGIYNFQNSNNLGQIKANVGISLSSIISYHLQLKSQPFYFRYQLIVPIAGMTFSPHYGQSYYEIFSLGNTSNVFLFSSFNNLFEIENKISVDIPLSFFTICIGYSNYYLNSHIHELNTNINSHSFLIGFVKKGLFFHEKKIKKQ